MFFSVFNRNIISIRNMFFSDKRHKNSFFFFVSSFFSSFYIDSLKYCKLICKYIICKYYLYETFLSLAKMIYAILSWCCFLLFKPCTHFIFGIKTWWTNSRAVSFDYFSFSIYNKFSKIPFYSIFGWRLIF